MWVALGSVRAAITNESDVRERFIFAASFRRSPAVPVLLCLSEPAKSTRFSFPILNAPGPRSPESVNVVNRHSLPVAASTYF